MTLVVIDAPTNHGLKPPAPGREPGVRRLASELRRRGLVNRLGARDGGAIASPPYEPDDAHRGIRNVDKVAAFADAQAKHIRATVRDGEQPLVLGGDCSILLGSLRALEGAGRLGLAYFDAHSDFATPERSGTGGAAGMDLALAVGRGPAPLAMPLLDEADVVHLGLREDDPVLRASRIRVVDFDTIRARGTEPIAEETRLQLERTDAFWIHIDADVVDLALMPAVDDPVPEGLGYDELRALVRPLLASPKCRGMQITIYDPDRDADGRAGDALTDALVEILR